MIKVTVTREDGRKLSLEGTQCVSLCMEAALAWGRVDGNIPDVQYLKCETEDHRQFTVRISREHVELFAKGITTDGPKDGSSSPSGEDPGVAEDTHEATAEDNSTGAGSSTGGDSDIPGSESGVAETSMALSGVREPGDE